MYKYLRHKKLREIQKIVKLSSKCQILFGLRQWRTAKSMLYLVVSSVVKCNIYKWSMALNLLPSLAFLEGGQMCSFFVRRFVLIFVYIFFMGHQTIRTIVFDVARIFYRFLTASFENIYLEVFGALRLNPFL